MLFVKGIVVTVKQRQEFRIRLQKRARRVAERKLEAFEEERQAKTVGCLIAWYVVLFQQSMLYDAVRCDEKCIMFTWRSWTSRRLILYNVILTPKFLTQYDT